MKIKLAYRASLLGLFFLLPTFSFAAETELKLGIVAYRSYFLLTEINGKICEVVSGLGLPRVEQRRLAYTLSGSVVKIRQIKSEKNAHIYVTDEDPLVDHVKCLR
jgi:hypothetical protein